MVELVTLLVSHREHVADDAAVQLEDVLLIQPIISHVCVVDEAELHESGDQELVYVAGHGFRFVFLPQHLINLPRGKKKTLQEIKLQS